MCLSICLHVYVCTKCLRVPTAVPASLNLCRCISASLLVALPPPPAVCLSLPPPHLYPAFSPLPLSLYPLPLCLSLCQCFPASTVSLPLCLYLFHFNCLNISCHSASAFSPLPVSMLLGSSASAHISASPSTTVHLPPCLFLSTDAFVAPPLPLYLCAFPIICSPLL